MKLNTWQILLIVVILLGGFIIAKNNGYLNWATPSYQPSNNNPPNKPPEVLPQAAWVTNFEQERLK